MSCTNSSETVGLVIGMSKTGVLAAHHGPPDKAFFDAKQYAPEKVRRFKTVDDVVAALAEKDLSPAFRAKMLENLAMNNVPYERIMGNLRGEEHLDYGYQQSARNFMRKAGINVKTPLEEVKKLGLSGGKLRYKDIMQIPRMFPNLEELDLSNNDISVLPTELADMQHLSKINLSGNRISQLPPNFEYLSLRELGIAHNEFDVDPLEGTAMKDNLELYDTAGNPFDPIVSPVGLTFSPGDVALPEILERSLLHGTPPYELTETPLRMPDYSVELPRNLGDITLGLSRAGTPDRELEVAFRSMKIGLRDDGQWSDNPPASRNDDMYNIPSSPADLFEAGEEIYTITDPKQSGDNEFAMDLFLDRVGVTEDMIEEHMGTQVTLFDGKRRITIDSGGLGDFHLHRFSVMVVEDDDIPDADKFSADRPHPAAFSTGTLWTPDREQQAHQVLGRANRMGKTTR
jgi:hypothetical protein